jgi:RND family efflux transporter MFP subunit
MTAEYNTIKPSKAGFLKRSLIYIFPFLCIIGFIFLGSIIIKLNNKPEEKKRAFNTLAVLADQAVLDDVQLSVKTQGEARPQTEIDLVPEIGGKIVYVSPNFIEGGIIKKGEVLLRIEDADYKVSVIRAQAQVAQAEQSVIREKAEGEIAKQDYQELGIGEASPLALRLPQQAQALASLQAAEAELAAANLQLKRTEVRSPFTGRVKSKNSDIGQYVSPGRTLGRIFSTGIVEVRLPLSDSDLSKLDLPVAYVSKNRASAINVKLSAVIAGERRYWNGKIMRTASTYDTQTRALFAIAEVVDPYGLGSSENGYPMAPGLFVDAEIAGKVYKEVIVLPRDGLRPDNEVYVVNDKGKTDIRKVDVLDSDSERALLLSGIEAGELVVLSPMEKSRVSMTLRALDVNNPDVILVDPPKPDWMKKLEGNKEGGGKGSVSFEKK